LNKYNSEKTSAPQNLFGLPKALFLAQEMGKGMG